MSTLRIPERLRHETEEIFKLTDPFCAEPLEAEARRKGLIPDLPVPSIQRDGVT